MVFLVNSECPNIIWVGKIDKHHGIFCLGSLTLQHAVYSVCLTDAHNVLDAVIGDFCGAGAPPCDADSGLFCDPSSLACLRK